ncbi:spindle assembly checkpoint component mad1 [Ceratobasidium sp. AG-Ba]|nr:spindle assembly checkpoint component mad1 [Ceratobasidium sp. AG-Ba]
MSKNLWERRVVIAQERITQLEAQIVERDAAHARVQAENARLVERERTAREGKTALESTVRSLKQDAESSKAALAAQVRELNATNAELQDAQESLAGTVESLKTNTSLLERKLSATETELHASQAQVTAKQNLANTLRAQLDDTLSEIKTLKASGAGSAGAGRDKEWAVVKEELARQTSHITQLTRHNAQLTRQLQEQQNAELVREENRALQSKVSELAAEVQRMARTESELRASLKAKETAPVESEKSIQEREAREAELARLRVQNAALLDEVGELKSAKHSRNSDVLGKEGEDAGEDDDAEATIAELEADAERLRGMVAALQVKVRVGSEERKVLRGILSSTYPDSDGALAARIEQLEKMLEQKDSETGVELGDVSMRSQVGDATFSTVRWEAVREREKREKAEEEIAELAAQIEAHEQTIENLEQTLFELRGEVAAGTHVQPGTRILQLADNPEARWFAMREEEVGRMREEISVLRGRVAEGGQVHQSTDSDGGVPRETYENLQREKEELEEVVKQKEKRLLRLKSVFQSKAVEFRDSISSLLGYKLHFEPKHVRLTSVYDRDIDLKFASGGGNQASMGPIRIGGGQNKDDIEAQVLELKTLWVDQKQNVPCFLANLTLYAYERAELGLSDWAGLDG